MIKSASLIPFDRTNSDLDLKLRVQAKREKATLLLDYSCVGNLGQILVPAWKQDPSRLEHLWEHTCFEAFLTWGQNPFYWELNFSPSGDWNLFHFASYRSGKIWEKRIEEIGRERPEIDALKNADQAWRVTLDLSPILPEDAQMELCLGISAVIEEQDQSKSYWALVHKGPQPDFHLRDSFILKV